MGPLKGFPRKIEAALEDGKFSYARKLINDAKYSENVRNQSWDLIPVLTKHFDEDTLSRQPELFRCCQYLLDKLSELANPEEAVLQFVSEVEEAETDLKFVSLLDPFAKLVCRIKTKRINSIIWSLNAIHTYLQKCDVPDYDNFNGKERLLVENAELVSGLRKLYEEVLSFYEVCLKNDHDFEVKNMLVKFLVQLLGPPLCYLHVELLGQVKTDGRILAERVVDKIFKVLSNPYTILELKQDVTQPDLLSIANLFYLIYCEGFGKAPQVYSGQFIFETTLPLITVLWEANNAILPGKGVAIAEKTNNVILCEKGLKLAETVLLKLKSQKLSYICLDNEEHKRFCLVLSHLVVYNSNEQVRKRGLQVLTDYLNIFEVKGFYLIVINLFDTLTHSGLKGYLITLYKDLLIKEFNNLSEYFRGAKLLNALKKFCLIEVDDAFVIDHSDQIVSALNLLRYLALKDKKNETQFWYFVELIQRQFLEPLEKGVAVSRDQFASEISTMDGSEEARKFHKELKEEKLSVLNSYLTALDVIESLLNRVKEIFGNK